MMSSNDLTYLERSPTSFPPVEPRAQVLPMEQLGWVDFERLCYRLVRIQPKYDEVRPYGIPGQAQEGIDIYARKTDSEKYDVFQCKREKEFGPSDICNAVERFLGGDWSSMSDTFVICATVDFSERNRNDEFERQATTLRTQGVTLKAWDRQQLSTMLKEHPELVYDFFGEAWAKAFLGNTEAEKAKRKSEEKAISQQTGIWQGHTLVKVGLEKPDDLPVPSYRYKEFYFRENLIGREDEVQNLKEAIINSDKKAIILAHMPLAGGTTISFRVIKLLVENHSQDVLPVYICPADDPTDEAKRFIRDVEREQLPKAVFIELGAMHNDSVKKWINSTKPLISNGGKVIVLGHLSRQEHMERALAAEYQEVEIEKITVGQIPGDKFIDFLSARRIKEQYLNQVSYLCDRLPGMLDLIIARPHPLLPDHQVKEMARGEIDALKQEYLENIDLSAARTKQLLALIAALQPLPENSEARKPFLEVIEAYLTAFDQSNVPDRNKVEIAIQTLIANHLFGLRATTHFSRGLYLSPRALTIFADHLNNLFVDDAVARKAAYFQLVQFAHEAVCENLKFVCEEKIENGKRYLNFPILEDAAKHLESIITAQDKTEILKLRKSVNLNLYSVMTELAKYAPKSMAVSVIELYRLWQEEYNEKDYMNDIEKQLAGEDDIHTQHLYTHERNLHPIIKILIERNEHLSVKNLDDLLKVLLQIHLKYPGREHDYDSPKNVLADLLKWRGRQVGENYEVIDFEQKFFFLSAIERLLAASTVLISESNKYDFFSFFSKAILALTNPQIESGYTKGRTYVFHAPPLASPNRGKANELIANSMSLIFGQLKNLALAKGLHDDFYKMIHDLVRQLHSADHLCQKIPPWNSWLTVMTDILDRAVDALLSLGTQTEQDVALGHIRRFFELFDKLDDPKLKSLHNKVQEHNLRIEPFKGFSLLIDASAFWDAKHEGIRKPEVTWEQFLSNAMKALDDDDAKAAAQLKSWIIRSFDATSLSGSSPAPNYLIEHVQQNRAGVIKALLKELIEEIKQRDLHDSIRALSHTVFVGFGLGINEEDVGLAIIIAKEILGHGLKAPPYLIPLLLDCLGGKLLVDNFPEKALDIITDLRSLSGLSIKDLSVRNLVILFERLWKARDEEEWRDKIRSEVIAWADLMSSSDTDVTAWFYDSIDIFAGGERGNANFIIFLNEKFMLWYRDAMDNTKLPIQDYHAARYLESIIIENPEYFYDKFFFYRIQKKDKELRAFPFKFFESIKLGKIPDNWDQRPFVSCLKRFLNDFPNIYGQVFINAGDWLSFWDRPFPNERGLPFSGHVRETFELWMNEPYDPREICRPEKGNEKDMNIILRGWKWWAIPMFLRECNFNQELCEFFYPVIKKCDAVMVGGRPSKDTIGKRFLVELSAAIGTTGVMFGPSSEYFASKAKMWKQIKLLHPDSEAWTWLFDLEEKSAIRDKETESLEEEENL